MQMTSADGQMPKPKRARCPICGAPAAIAHRPFCSRRCADIDLSRWFRGRYQIAGSAEEDQSSAADSGGEDEDAIHPGGGVKE
jgi:endogenous inhibitor of DNA gyrase (YacG/DUF329 family)